MRSRRAPALCRLHRGVVAPMSDDAQKVTEALREHHVEVVQSAEWSFGWQCLTCGAEGWSWSVFTDAEQDAITHHVAAVLAALDLPARDARVAAGALREAADEIDASRSMLGIASRALDPGRAYAVAHLRDLATKGDRRE